MTVAGLVNISFIDTGDHFVKITGLFEFIFNYVSKFCVSVIYIEIKNIIS